MHSGLRQQSTHRWEMDSTAGKQQKPPQWLAAPNKRKSINKDKYYIYIPKHKTKQKTIPKLSRNLNHKQETELHWVHKKTPKHKLKAQKTFTEIPENSSNLKQKTRKTKKQTKRNPIWIPKYKQDPLRTLNRTTDMTTKEILLRC